MEKSKAQKEAQKRYMNRFGVLRVRMDTDKCKQVKAHAEARGESLNKFINRAIDETMQRDQAGQSAGQALSAEEAV